jgi:hypothetical protein
MPPILSLTHQEGTFMHARLILRNIGVERRERTRKKKGQRSVIGFIAVSSSFLSLAFVCLMYDALLIFDCRERQCHYYCVRESR